MWRGGVQVSVEDKSAIARTGKWALYSALKQCCPSTIRSDDPFIGRHGLTEIEFNKVLERNGFNKIRDRSGASSTIMEGRQETDDEDGKECAAKKGMRRGSSAVYPACVLLRRARVQDCASQRPPATACRLQRCVVVTESVACAAALLYFFSNRRWRDPDDPKDLEQLQTAWQQLADSSIVFAGQCKFERMCKVLKTFCRQWEQVETLPKVSKKMHRRAASNEPEARAQKRKLNDDDMLSDTPLPWLTPNQRYPGPDRSARSGDLGLALPGLTALASAPIPALLPSHGAYLNQPGEPAAPVDIQLVLALMGLSSLTQQQPGSEILKQLVLNQLVQQRLALPTRKSTPSLAGIQFQNPPEWATARVPARCENLAAFEAGPRLPPMRSAGASASATQGPDPLVAMFAKSH